jgi:hypothetical protein
VIYIEKIPPGSSWNLPPTEKQTRAIAELCMRRGIRELLEETPSDRREARNLIYELRKKGAKWVNV